MAFNKIFTQKDFREGISPQPGMIFISDDNRFFKVMDYHPRSREEPCIGYTNREVEDDEDWFNYRKEYWAVRELVKEEIDILVRKEK